MADAFAFRVFAMYHALMKKELKLSSLTPAMRVHLIRAVRGPYFPRDRGAMSSVRGLEQRGLLTVEQVGPVKVAHATQAGRHLLEAVFAESNR